MTADERDRKIVASVEDWWYVRRREGGLANVIYAKAGMPGSHEDDAAADAAVRILNRIAREERRKAKKGKR